jgi:DNA-binding transcriptional regulator YhcF (GntR family)
MAWSFTSDRPVYVQLAERLRKKIISSEYSAGEQIPSVRQLASETAVNPNTVQRALAELEDEGLLEVRGTLGKFVTEDREIIERSRREQAKSLVRSFVASAAEMSIPTEELLSMIQEEINERS